MKIKLSISPCPNDTFMFDALVNGRIGTRGLDFELRFDDIERLNASVLAGDVDVSKISCAILPQIWERYAMLRSGAALGRGNGPLLVAREGSGFDVTAAGRRVSDGALAGRADGPRVAIPGLHTTANLLMSRLYPHIVDKPCYLFSDIADAVARGECDAGVLIHEGRFTYRAKGLTLAADLGAEWEKATGLPLPLGAIVVSRKLPVEVQHLVQELLRESVAYAFGHRAASAEFVKCHARELSEEVMRQHIDMFVNDFSLDIGPEGERAVRSLTALNSEEDFRVSPALTPRMGVW